MAECFLLKKGSQSNEIERHYIYLNGEEMNGHTITPYVNDGSITKDSKCIIMDSRSNVFIESELIQKGSFTRVGARLCTLPYSGWYRCSVGVSDTFGYLEGWLNDNNQRHPKGNFKYALCTPDQNSLKAIDEFYYDIPDTYSEFCAIVHTCGRTTYVGAIWLE